MAISLAPLIFWIYFSIPCQTHINIHLHSIISKFLFGRLTFSAGSLLNITKKPFENSSHTYFAAIGMTTQSPILQSSDEVIFWKAKLVWWAIAINSPSPLFPSRHDISKYIAKYENFQLAHFSKLMAKFLFCLVQLV